MKMRNLSLILTASNIYLETHSSMKDGRVWMGKDWEIWIGVEYVPECFLFNDIQHVEVALGVARHH